MKITEKEFNIQTGEETIIERDETTEETKTRLDREKELQAQAVLDAQKADAKVAIAERLGLSADELATLLG
jgi:hypothetical protein